MKKYIGKRIMISLVTLLIIILVLFMLLQLMPGSPFNDEKLTADQIAMMSKKYGLDKRFYLSIPASTRAYASCRGCNMHSTELPAGLPSPPVPHLLHKAPD